MKIKCLVNCNGVGYENFKVGEIRDVTKETAEKLVDFGYAEKISIKISIKKTSDKKEGNGNSTESGEPCKTDGTGETDETNKTDGTGETDETNKPDGTDVTKE